jgi:hypothetical protein
VPAAEEAVAPWRAAHDQWAARGVPAHVTVQSPFLAPRDIDTRVLERLGALLESARAETFELRAARYLPGIVYLAPVSDEPFARLTRLVAGAWPELPRYGTGLRSIGRYHLTVARTLSPSVPGAVRRGLRPFLPIAGRTEQALLFAVDANERVDLLACFGIGSSREP